MSRSSPASTKKWWWCRTRRCVSSRADRRKLRSRAMAGRPARCWARPGPPGRGAGLTPEKYKKCEEMARQRPGGRRRATLWTYEDGAFWPHEVRLGLADGSVTEVAEGLAEGAQVVVRVREA